MHRSSGFTLVELIVVMSVLGLVSFGAVSLITRSSSGYADTVARAELVARGQLVMSRIEIAVNNALPRSVRTNGNCLELVPVVGAARFLTLPVAHADTQFSVVASTVHNSAAEYRAAVAPTASIYQLGPLARLSPLVSISAEQADASAIVTLASAHQFASESARNTVFWVDEPVSFCVDGNGDLWRYRDYGYRAVQPAVADLPSSLPNRALIAEAAAVSFSVDPATLTRNAVVDVVLLLNLNGSSLQLDQRMQVRNAT